MVNHPGIVFIMRTCPLKRYHLGDLDWFAMVVSGEFN
jgi:hypothetical protein